MGGVTLRDLTVTYRRVPAVHHVSGQFAASSLTAVTGPNGAGKSTLLKAIMGFAPIAEGHIDRGGLHPRMIAYLPQAHEIDRRFPITAGDLVSLGAWRRHGMFGGATEQDLALVDAALDSVGLGGQERTPIDALSVGQFQRALFARLSLFASPLVLLDEPFAGVDDATTQHLVALIKDWAQAGRTVVAVLHDLTQIAAHFPQTLLLARECVAWGPTETVLTPENLSRAEALTKAWATEAARRMAEGRQRRQSGSAEHAH